MRAGPDGAPAEAGEPVVIVGGGFGGLFTALELAKAAPHRRIVLLEPRARFLFLPLLYELLSGELASWQVAPTYARLLSGSGVIHLREQARTIHTARRTVELASGAHLPFGTCVIATGSVPETFGIPGMAENAGSFHDLADVTRLRTLVHDLRSRDRPLQRLAVVGAGATGVELSCKLADLLQGAAAIELIERGGSLLPAAKAFNREQAAAALQKRDVRVRLRSEVLEAAPGLIRLSTQVGEGSRVEESLPVQGLLWAAGVRARPPALDPPAGLDRRGRLRCGADLRVHGCEAVFAIGDVAGPGDGEEPGFPATAQVAFQQARHLASTLAIHDGGEVLPPFVWQDLGEMISLGIGEATITGLGLTLAGPAAFQIRRLTYLARLPGLPMQLRAAASWLLDAAAARHD